MTLPGFPLVPWNVTASLQEQKIEAGDIVLGLGSNGVHSNGFALVRKIIEDLELDYSNEAPFGDGTLGRTLLTPTVLYVNACLAALKVGGVHAMAHITGGGLTENLPRVSAGWLGCYH